MESAEDLDYSYEIIVFLMGFGYISSFSFEIIVFLMGFGNESSFFTYRLL